MEIELIADRYAAELTEYAFIREQETRQEDEGPSFEGVQDVTAFVRQQMLAFELPF